LDPSTLVAPKNTGSAVRVQVSLGDRVLGKTEVEQLVGGPFQIRAELSGPGLPQAVTLPVANAPVLADPFLVAVPPLSTGGEYTLSGARVMVDGRSVLDAAPLRAPFQVIDQLLVTSVKTRELTPEEAAARGVVLGPDAYLVFEFSLGLLLESEPITIELPVVFDRE